MEQNKTVRLLKAKPRRSSGSENYASGTNIGSPIIKKPIGIVRTKNKHIKKTKEGKIKVLNAEGEDVAPRPLSHSDPVAKRSLFFLEELKEQSESSSSTSDSSDVSSRHSVTAVTSQGTTGSLTFAPEESLSVFESQKPQKVQHEEAERETEVTEEMLDELVQICLSETETISLLDIPSSVLPEDAEEWIKRNRCYVELCKGKPGNEKFVEREMQTMNNAPKTTWIQTDTVVIADTGSLATDWGICDSMNQLANSMDDSDNENTDGTENMVKTTGNNERSLESNTSTATDSTGYSSLPDHQDNVEGHESGADLQAVMNSKELLQSLRITERSIVANTFQHKLATYKGLPILQDPCNTEAGVPEKQDEKRPVSEGDHPEVLPDEAPLRPDLSLLWSFNCELTAGCVATSISWHKKSTDILAVGYDNSANNKTTPGLICVWSLKNITWPERVIYCHSVVTTLDFSPNVPAHLGVGMMDGTVAIYNMANRHCVAITTQSSKKHFHRVCLVSWRKQVLVSISVDGLIKSWLLGPKSFECIDLFQLKCVKSSKKASVETMKKSETVLGGGIAAGLCFHFHPVDMTIYLSGTRQGLIHMCSYSNRVSFMETFRKHLRPVNCIEWSPFSPNFFLSGSSDRTVQLWKRDSPRPVLGFSSFQAEVLAVHWSPKWPAVFATLTAKRLEIMDLKTSILDPTLVLSAPESTELTSVQFCPDTDAVVLGDSRGEVRVYQLQNLGLSPHGQVVRLEDVILNH